MLPNPFPTASRRFGGASPPFVRHPRFFRPPPQQGASIRLSVSVEEARRAVDALSSKLGARSETRFTLDGNSSDLLLVLLLPKIDRHLAQSSLEAATEGVARVRWLAERFQEFQSSEVKADASAA
jgi:hypothetical protein